MNKVDEKSLENAKRLFASNDINSIEVGTVKGLSKYINIYLMACHDFAGQIRKKKYFQRKF